ncbi:MAG: orotidine-5'-phosphate decarboxylase [Gammaproteobacteria bacterium]|nr:orotidine-5'-phosphate decarboxylase [Gammaproteobacteria bacterium]
MKSDNKRIIVTLDVATAGEANLLLEQLDASLCRVKVGKQLFTSCGPELVREIVGKGFDVFLDLKFHDIPNTVAGAVEAAAELGVWMLNIHASGGRAMMEAAANVLANRGAGAPLLIGVTVLTSMAQEDLAEVGVPATPEAQVKRLALLSAESGLDGVVCSAAETRMLRESTAAGFCLVTPGIRRPEDAAGDQKRVVGPAQAIENGSTYLVIGRPINKAESPLQSLQAFNAEVSGALSSSHSSTLSSTHSSTQAS